MMFRTLLRISIILCFALAAIRSDAQQAPAPSVNLPVLGFVLDQTGGLRPVFGISGSASVGAAVDLGFGITQAAVPPGHDYVVAISTSGSGPVLLQTRGNAITVVPNAFSTYAGGEIEDCRDPAFDNEGPRARCRSMSARANGIGNISQIALSPSGSSAAFLNAAQGRIYAFSNLAQAPVSSGSFDVSALGTVTAFGISDDARTVVCAVWDGNSGSLYLVSSEQPRLIGSIHHASAIQFMHNSDGAVIADDLDNRVYALTGGQVYAIASATDGISGPVGIGVSNNNQKVFVGNAVSSSVTTISLNGASAQSTACNCALTGLKPTNSDSVFQLTDFSGGPILLFDGNSAAPRTVFVPVATQF